MARRCSTCSINWPDQPDPSVMTDRHVVSSPHVTPLPQGYEVCPQCGAPTDHMVNVDPLDADTARTLKLWCEFERYCENRPGATVQSAAA